MDAELHRLLMKKAGTLLARRSYSRGELRTELAKIAGELTVDSVLDRLEQLNLLNDAEYAYNFAFCRMRQHGWGPAKVQHALLRRQVHETVIENALDRVRNELRGESDLKAYVRGYCGKGNLPQDLKGLRKLVQHLRRRGFDDDAIMSALRQTLPAELWRQFETGE